jgi:RNA polymerase sigma-70 factor (ECF subfamily)
MLELDDITLARAQRGDRTAAHALIVTYQDRVYALVSRLLYRHGHLVDDLAQDVFLKVIRAIDRFDRQGPARLSTWILTIATRTCLDALGQLSRRDQLGNGWVAPPSSNLERDVAHTQLTEHVTRALEDLPEDHRAVLVLRAYHDLDYDEIAEVLHIEPGTVKSRLNRARERLRQLFPGATHG